MVSVVTARRLQLVWTPTHTGSFPAHEKEFVVGSDLMLEQIITGRKIQFEFQDGAKNNPQSASVISCVTPGSHSLPRLAAAEKRHTFQPLGSPW